MAEVSEAQRISEYQQLTEKAEAYAAEHGVPALLDHLGLDGLGNEVVAMRTDRDRYREALERTESLTQEALVKGIEAGFKQGVEWGRKYPDGDPPNTWTTPTPSLNSNPVEQREQDWGMFVEEER